jgi:DNA polymerase-3 subunit delta'
VSVWSSLGGSPIVAGLARQVGRDASGHAWLLLGPSGSGKVAAANAIAAALNCPVEPRVGCGTCATCARILRGRHPDVHQVMPEGPLIPVDVIREQVVPEAARSPFEASFKVFLILEADRMNPAAQNALLKTLEEPQPDTVFVLVSENEEELLETLRSRCRVVRMEPLSEQRIADYLEREGAEPSRIAVAARASLGDLEAARAYAFDATRTERRALWASIPGRLTGPVEALGAAADVLEQARAAVKERELSQREEVAELAEALGEGRGTATARNALAKRHRRELKRLEEEVIGEALAFVGLFFRDVVAVRARARAATINIDVDGELLEWTRGGVSDRALLGASERCLSARASFVNNANASLAVEAAFVELTLLIRPPDAAALEHTPS